MDNNQSIIQSILDWNQTKLSTYDSSFFKQHSSQQSPQITVLSCCDARVQTTVLAEEPINQIFHVSVIGNAFDEAIGSLDFGIYNLHTPILMILGHSNCGAIEACMHSDTPLSNDTSRCIDDIKSGLHDVHSKESSAFIKENIHNQVQKAYNHYKELIDKQELLVVGAYYDFANDFHQGNGKLHIINTNTIKY